MRIALAGAELEENLGLRYMASMLESRGHEVEIVPFNSGRDISQAVGRIIAYNPDITGLSMVFTSRAQEFCNLAESLRAKDYRGHIIAGGHFAALNKRRLLQDHPSFDSVGLGEGEEIICALADHLPDPAQVAGLCYRRPDGSIAVNPSTGNPDDLDVMPFPKRSTFHSYYGKPIASILSSRGCWRDCAFCSINAWYKQGGGKKFRIRSVASIVAEMKQLYFDHGIRIFNFQDDNFFLPDRAQAARRFESLREALQQEGVEGIAIAVKARPDSITYETIRVLDDLGLFRVFLGVENASERALRNLNRRCKIEDILNALRILNDFDVHIAYNLLMFELDTTMADIHTNLRFIERHIDNPFNFCRAEAYAGTGLEEKLKTQGRLLGDYFGFDYRIKDLQAEIFHQIANFAFFDRNFSDSGLHYFNMQVDFCFQLLRRFYPERLTQSLRGAARTFIKRTNLDTYELLCRIFDFVSGVDPTNQAVVKAFAGHVREEVDARSAGLHAQGEQILEWLDAAYEGRAPDVSLAEPSPKAADLPFVKNRLVPYRGLESLDAHSAPSWTEAMDLFNVLPGVVPYDVFKKRMSQKAQEGR